ncbi:transcriptional regulator [Virgisporangium aliadipatigenens]|uniref:Transcriptional regulator n=1 Tax=Virgisporangium aliadipatigenens TaxID=741659 RepID=A0A8J3YUF4_9ACTN|nr:helix-turn-helix transcriptional regulator [Virgisporangium aliadipatigenens]GIJ49958.1 transcriptional regulator [Virgisporangium aliadipatigenens]
MAPSGRPIGEALGVIRRRRGLTQEQLAERSAVSLSVIRKLERNDRDSASLATLRKLAGALDVTTVELFQPTPQFERPPADDDGELYAIRRSLQPARSLGSQPAVTLADVEQTPTLDTLRDSVREINGLFRDSNYAAAVAALPSAIEHARLATMDPPATERDEMWRQLSQTYLTAGMILIQIRRDDLAYHALGLAIDAGREINDDVLVASAVCSENWLLTRQGRFDDAERAALNSAEAIEPSFTRSPLWHVAVWGWLNLGAAAAATRNNRVDVADEALRRARAAAYITARYRSPHVAHWTGLSPSVVTMRQVELAVVAGDVDQALRHAREVPDDATPRVTHQRFLLDVAAAHLERRQREEALAILLGLHSTVPGWLRHQRYARSLTGQLLRGRARTIPTPLRELADFLDVQD